MSRSTASWAIAASRATPAKLATARIEKEEDLEDWIEQNPALLESGLRILARQLDTESGPLDLLALDRDGSLVVIELKRDKAYRETLAQVIDYTAIIRGLSRERLTALVNLNRKSRRVTGTFDDVLREALGDVAAAAWSSDESACRMVVAGQGADAALRRMIEFLAATHDVPVTAVVFDVYAHAGERLLVRSEIAATDDADDVGHGRGRGGMTHEQLMSVAQEHKTRDLVEPILSAWRDLTGRVGRAERGGYWTLAKRADGRQAACRLYPIDSAAPSDEVAWLFCDLDALADDAGMRREEVLKVLGDKIDKEDGYVRLASKADADTAAELLKELFII